MESTIQMNSPPAPRLRELDSLRGLAAIGVLFWHYQGHFHAKPLAEVFEAFYRAGYYAVDFFFVLSGLVLARAYANEYRSHRFAENMVKRVARIFPLHLVTLVLVALGQYVLVELMERRPFIVPYNDLYHFALNLGLAQYVGFQSGFSFNAPSWSISTEFWVNVLFFIVISVGWKRLFPISLGIAAVSLALVVTTGNGSLGAANTVAYPAITLIRTAFGFFVGVALHEAAFREPRAHASNSLLFDAIFIAVIALLTWGALGHLPFHPRFEVLSVLVAFPVLLLAASRSVLVKQTLRLSPLTFLGDISFSIYLLHFPLQLLLHVFVVGGWVALDFQSGWILLLFLGMTIGIATFSYYLVELPAQRAVNRWWAVRSKSKTFA